MVTCYLHTKVSRADAQRRAVAKHLSASRKAEVRYVRDLLAIMGNVHREALRIAKKHLPAPSRGDAASAFGPRFRDHIFRYLRDAVPPAFDRMAAAVDKKSQAAAKELGLQAKAYDLERRRVPIKDIVFPGGKKGVPPVWEEAKVEHHRARMRAGHAPEPVDLTTVGTGGELRLVNGIHRTQAALEAGHTHMPALIRHPKGKGPKGSLIGIAPKSLGIENLIENTRAANVRLVRKASGTFLDQVEDVLAGGFGDRVEDLADELEERVGVSASRASLIARDQTLKLNAAIAQTRMASAGVVSYTWSTSKDERVRPAHAELEGQRFRFDDPPETNDAGDTNNPGEDFQCRCVAIPVLDEDEGVGADLDVAAEE